MKGFIVVLLVGVFENGTNITALIADIPFYVIHNFVFNKVALSIYVLSIQEQKGKFPSRRFLSSN